MELLGEKKIINLQDDSRLSMKILIFLLGKEYTYERNTQ